MLAALLLTALSAPQAHAGTLFYAGIATDVDTQVAPVSIEASFGGGLVAGPVELRGGFDAMLTPQCTETCRFTPGIRPEVGVGLRLPLGPLRLVPNVAMGIGLGPDLSGVASSVPRFEGGLALDLPPGKHAARVGVAGFTEAPNQGTVYGGQLGLTWMIGG